MALTSASRRITRAVSDGTGLSPEEVWLLVAAATIAATVHALLRAVDLVLDVWQDSTDGDRQ